jgi:FAD:protein FMN transferase
VAEPGRLPSSRHATARWNAIGTTVRIAVTDPVRIGAAEELARRRLEALDSACSRFRPDAEILTLSETPRQVSPLLFRIVEVSREVARYTEGAVDPTVGSTMLALGYDRDFGELGEGTEGAGPRCAPAPGWRGISLDRASRTVQLPPATVLDVGASAKAFAADGIAALIATTLDTGALVDLGGDIAVAGPPPAGGWAVGVGPRSDGPPDQVIALLSGGLATSSPEVRTWVVGGQRRSHIVDPRTGRPAPRWWHTVSACAPTAVESNALTTAAVVWGADAPGAIDARRGTARLVDYGGRVHCTGLWPRDPRSAAA